MNRILWFTFVVILIAIDQYSKYLTETTLPLQQPIPFLPYIDLFRTYNYGVAFSMLSFLNGWPLNLLTCAIILFILWLWNSLDKGQRLASFGYAMIVGGAIGNLIDRVNLGKVVDMILFHIESLNFYFAVFNLADTFISIGAAAIILDEILKWRSSKNTPDADILDNKEKQ